MSTSLLQVLLSSFGLFFFLFFGAIVVLAHS